MFEIDNVVHVSKMYKVIFIKLHYKISLMLRYIRHYTLCIEMSDKMNWRYKSLLSCQDTTGKCRKDVFE